MIIDDDSYHWVVTRIGIVSSFSLLAINVITIVVVLIFVSGAPSLTSENILSLIISKLDAILSIAALILIAVGGIVIAFVERLRIFYRQTLPWLISIAIITGVGWWILSIIDQSKKSVTL